MYKYIYIIKLIYKTILKFGSYMILFFYLFFVPKHRKFKCLDRFRLVARHQVAVPATRPQLRDSPKCQEDTCRPPW